MLLKNYYPSYLVKSKIFSAVLDTMQIELDNIDNIVKDIVNQCFVDTATWGLKYWEEMLGIPTDESKPYEFRRSVIKSKIRGSGTITVNLIKNVSESFSNGEVEVIEQPSIYSFTVKFVGTIGIPPNLDDLKKAIEEIKPAHLGVIYEIIYNTHDSLSIFTHDHLSLYTYSQLRETEVI